MPKEGLKESKSPAIARTAKPKTAPSHRLADIVGIGLIAAALIVLVTLALGRGGLVGDSVVGVLRSLFGQGAWAFPLVLAFAGVCLLAGRKDFVISRTVWGVVLMCLGILGGFARALHGDFFDPEVISQSGGYVGALAGWAMSVLLGPAALVGLISFGMVGVVFCLDQPLREVWMRLDQRRQNPQPSRDGGQQLKSDEAAETKRRAAVRMLGDKAAIDVATVDSETEPPKVRSKFSMREADSNVKSPAVAPVVNLDTSVGEPREGYTLPPLNLLSEPSAKAKRNPQEVQKNIEILENTLEQFNIDANVVEVANGPTITRYEVQLGPGIRVNRITALADNIAMSLAASHVRVEAPIPGKNAIGVEVPTAVRQMVTLREMCESLEFHDQGNKLMVALGKDVSGQAKYTDLTRMPHLLIGGATNSGKSICLATLIMSLILKLTPKELRLVMIDPKRVELTLFEGLPHLMCPVVKDVKEAAGVLRAVVREMDRRYDKFSDASVRNIDGWNNKVEFQDKLPYVVVIVDELADLMIQCGPEVETSICRLAQLARATGIHLVIATQRPSVDVITGTIKNNISSRIAFAVSSHIDSRTILDQSGADKLIGKGDMLFLPIDATKAVRIQGCYVTEKEIEEVCTFWRRQEKPHYVLNPIQIAIDEKESDLKEAQDDDPLWAEVCRFVVSRGQASTSMIQRKFSIGFQRASRLLDMMEERSIVGARDGPRPREVLIDVVRMEQLLGNNAFMAPMAADEYIGDDE